MKRRKNPYGEPFTVGLITLAIVGAGHLTAGQSKKYLAEQKGKQRKAESSLRAQEKDTRIAQQEAKIASAEAQKSVQELEYRKNLHSQMVESERQTTSYVDDARAKVGFVGEDFDRATLDRVWGAQREIAEAELAEAIKRERKENDQNETINYGRIALYSFLGLASVGTVMYLKRRR